MNKSTTLFFILSIFCLHACSNKKMLLNELSIQGYSPVYPVLIEKTYNPVFRVNIELDSLANSIEVKKFVINLEGTTDLKDIKSVHLFYTENKTNFSTQTLIATTSTISKTITFNHQPTLKNGANYFWLAISLADNTNLEHTINATIQKVKTNNKTFLVAPINEFKPKNIGHALRQHKDDGVHTYRIPGLVTTNKGTLLAVYDTRRNGSVDLQEDIDIGLNRSVDGGQTWSPMKIIMDMGKWGGLPENQNGIGDPSILVDKVTNTIWVAGVWAHGHPEKRNWWASKQGMTPKETSQFMLVKSTDDGLTWSDPINITSQIKDSKWHLLLQGPGKGITMQDGTLVFPAQFKDEYQMPYSTIIYSKDHGKTWKIGTGVKSNTTESQVVELKDHSIMINMRDNRGGKINGKKGKGARSVAITTDLGKTWIEHTTSRKALPEPVCMASLIKHNYKSETLLLFSNPADEYSRKNMTIKISRDEGLTWNKNLHTLIDEGTGRGYSCMTSIDENTIGILYEGSQSDLVFQKVKLDVLMQTIK